MSSWKILSILILIGLYGASCKEESTQPIDDTDPPIIVQPKDSTTLDDGPIDFSQLNDTYPQYASAETAMEWRHYNTHDPAIINDEKFYYSYSTDVCFGCDIKPGVQIRRSINMVEWEFVGWVFNGLPTKGSNYIRRNGGEPFNSLWAPYAIKVGDEYRVYYSLSSAVGRLSCIGLAVSDDPKGPFIERDVVVGSLPGNTNQPNAIDPTVIVDDAGKHWMYYGSSWDGIYRLEIDPETGLALRNDDIGMRVAHRGFTNGTMNGNIEGPEIIFNQEQNMYYMFIAYDWLETKYNVRVGRSTSPSGPFFDYFGNNLNVLEDNLPMIIAPYRFIGHSGWQGVSHPGVFKADDGNFYIAHQGRPAVNPFYMVMHVRQLFWTEDGWPIASSQRYAGEEETEVDISEIAGTWERIHFDYRVVPGFAEEQILPDMQIAETITLESEGTINENSTHTWSYDAPWLTLSWNDGALVDKVRLERGRDWENQVEKTLLFTGFDNETTLVWGKKID